VPAFVCSKEISVSDGIYKFVVSLPDCHAERGHDGRRPGQLASAASFWLAY